MKNLNLLLLITFLGHSLTGFGQEKTVTPVKLDNEGFLEILVQADKLYISGQPEKKGLLKLKEQGLTTVVNLRTDREMDNRNVVPYDEAAFVDSLGMKYVHIPLGGKKNPYTPKAVDQFNEALNASQGKVLLHCTVAWRASHLWAAYLVKYKGMDANKALELGKQVNLGTLPIESFLDRKISLKEQ